MNIAQTLETRIPPPVVMLVLGFLAWLGVRYLPALSFHVPHGSIIAVAVAAAGLVLNALPKLAFDRAATTVNPLRPGAASHLVTSGLYRYSRNPMYLGHAMMLLGWCIHLDNLASFAAVPAFVLYISRFQIKPEEQHLRARFGEQYATFCSHSPRWL